MRYFGATLFITLSFSLAAEAGTIRVPSDEPTIQAGIDAAADGDTVLVANGTYAGEGNRDIDFGGKAIVVTSEGGSGRTSIDCENRGRGFSFTKGEGKNSVLSGFCIRNGEIDGSGGGIYCLSSSPVIQDCTIRKNRCTGAGGGIFCHGSSPRITGCGLYENQAMDNLDGDGGGIACVEGSSPSIANCAIDGNDARSDGGAIYCRDSSPVIRDCSASRNRGDDGAAIHCMSADPIITGCDIIDNGGRDDGGGIYCELSSPIIFDCRINFHKASQGGAIFCRYGNPYIIDCEILGNNAFGWAHGGDGGGIHCFVADPLITGCTIGNNWSEEGGGAISCFYSFPVIERCLIHNNSAADGGGIHCRCKSAPDIRACTIVDNIALDNGGGICSLEDSHPSITDCILWNDSPAEIFFSGWVISVTFSDIRDGWDGAGNIDSDPLFIDPENVDYRLMPGSPCIDAGNPASPIPYGGGCRIDMGALEYGKGFNCDDTIRCRTVSCKSRSRNPACPGTVTYLFQFRI